MRRMLAVCLILLASPVRAEEGPLDALRGALLEARGNDAVSRALDEASSRIGAEGGFADAAEFADWLAALPESRADHPLVLLRRGWALLAARRGAEAVGVLEAAIDRGAPEPLALAYLGDALRQSGRPEEAIRTLAAAARAGYAEPFAAESALKAAFDLRRAGEPHAGEGLPAYAVALAPFLLATNDSATHAALARMLLEDRRRFVSGGATRDGLWAAAAAGHARAALSGGAQIEGGAALAWEAAEAVRAGDGDESQGATPRFDLLAETVRRADGTDEILLAKALVALAAAARDEERYELAARLARRRLDIGDSPVARDLLAGLPPDLAE